MRFQFCGLLLLFCISATVKAEPLLFLVRHAEKSDVSAGDAKDPELSPAGRTRAEALAHMLRDADLTAVFATEFKRTQQTAEPTARSAGTDVSIVAAKDTAALVSRLREQKGNVLVVGHSNTLPEILQALGVQTRVSLAEADYDNLLVVTMQPEPRLLRLHY